MSRPGRPEVLALLADVKENPNDLTPWLVLTDWLDENGDEADRARAEYCRLCFDKFGKKTYASDWEKGERRRELFREHKDAWLGPLVGLLDGFRCRVERGLLLVWGNGAVELSRLMSVSEEQWAWVEQLNISNLTSQDIQHLALSPLLDGPVLISLGVMYKQRVTQDAVRALAESPRLERVRKLSLSGAPDLKRKAPAKDIDNFFAPLRDRFGARFRSLG